MMPLLFMMMCMPATLIPLPSPPLALYPSWFTPSPQVIFPNLSLLEGFILGTAMSTYQVEGAVMNEGKGPQVWDRAPRLLGEWCVRLCAFCANVAFEGVVADGMNGEDCHYAVCFKQLRNCV